MRKSIGNRRARIAVGAVVFAIGLLVGPLTIQSSHAYVSGCDLDPTVYLSNGAVVTMDASLNDSITDVQSATFVLHVPWGVAANSIIKDSNSALENVLVIQGNSYYSDTLVSTFTSGVQVTAFSSLTFSEDWTQQRSSSGSAGQHLVIWLRSRGDD